MAFGVFNATKSALFAFRSIRKQTTGSKICKTDANVAKFLVGDDLEEAEAVPNFLLTRFYNEHLMCNTLVHETSTHTRISACFTSINA